MPWRKSRFTKWPHRTRWSDQQIPPDGNHCSSNYTYNRLLQENATIFQEVWNDSFGCLKWSLLLHISDHIATSSLVAESRPHDGGWGLPSRVQVQKLHRVHENVWVVNFKVLLNKPFLFDTSHQPVKEQENKNEAKEKKCWAAFRILLSLNNTILKN